MRLNRNMLSMRSGSYNMQTSVFRSGEFFPEHCHDFHEFFLVADGILEHTLNGKISRSVQPSQKVPCVCPYVVNPPHNGTLISFVNFFGSQILK